MERRHAQFVNNRRADLVQRVIAVMDIADALKSAEIIQPETYSNIYAASTRMEKMRELLDALNTDQAKSAFYSLLKDKESSLVVDLEQQGVKQGIKGAQTSSEVLENKSRPQNAETLQVQTIEQKTEEKQIMWNKSSKTHSTKIEELLKKTDIKKVGNLYFYKDEKYVIGSGGSSSQVYIGLSEDGTEVAIKRIMKNPKNNKDFDNELKCLQDLKLESKYIVRYVTFVADEDFYYLANQLCEYDLEDYMKELRQQERNDKENILRKIVKEMLLGLQVLHRAEVIHRDIKPRNVLIDTEGKARLADFGISRKLEEGKTTVYTDRAGTQGWEATEILNQTDSKGRYKMSSDIQVAGMLVYYILSDGKHPFGDMDREGNIKIGKYTLEHVQDIVAKDLIEWMINKEPAERLTIDEVLRHPYFWDDSSKDAVLRKLGDRPEIQNYETLSKLRNLYIEKEHTEETDPIATLTIYEAFNQLKIENEKKRNDILAIVGEDLKNLWKLFNTAKDVTEGKSFSNWKSKLSEIWTDINKKLPEDILGLLRVLRNKLVHANVRNEFEERNIFGLFPDFFISLHRVAKDLNWNY
ncbi:uncharacterized protein LOC127509541 isoform X1 [Ctenopharyngodon idella]|uniref:uncharacterized protein LOC127509541 isoform X1 n=1 Tax=Ctenopharyngodon idella TaxID=7959 RepID=UPI00222FC5DC|nr:uncharacterized protein LOC127509541 isoform X1 [Ctenopharyngodon idella]XP_051744295.1 uncharacterized protein LOC127509541 isoform X2 [Ctenopharyngodon idella]XP_051744296.1 uncharacterized protein LOC127509541 isoform X1 [Ctenopharyngodon idella]XP_051744297.1 uncharacterized protein LOC127509541 isoform X1 [Ctenopharyngodon idella]